MNKENINIQSQQNDPKKDIGNKVSLLINKILNEPNQNFGDRINHVINKVLDSIPQNISNNPKLQKEIFDKIADFLNKTFKNVDIKKFYNTMPNIDIRQYAKKDLGNSFINNIYGKERKIFYRNNVQGGSCHHRTIFFKKIFEELESKGFDIKSRIIDTGHSAVILKFLGEKYFVDMYGINEKHKLVVATSDFLNKKEKTKIFSKFSFNKEKDDGLFYFDDIQSFVDFLKNIQKDTESIEFKPRLENGEEIDVRIEIAEEYISLIINGKIKKYRTNKIKIPSYLKNSPEILDFIVKSLSCQKENKCEISKYIKMVRHKIDPEKVYDIFNQKENN